MKLNFPPASLANLTLRQQIRLDIAIEFARKRVMTEKFWAETREAHEKMRDQLKEKITAAKKYEFRDEPVNAWEDEL